MFVSEQQIVFVFAKPVFVSGQVFTSEQMKTKNFLRTLFLLDAAILLSLVFSPTDIRKRQISKEGNEMQRTFLLVAKAALLGLMALSLSSAVWGAQVCEPASTLSKVRGIERISMSFDAGMENGKFVFQNATSHKISAYHAVLLEQRANGDMTRREISAELLLAEPEVLLTKHQTGGNSLMVGPGDTHTDQIIIGHSYDSRLKLVCAQLVMDVVIYANNTYESANPKALNEILEGRRRSAQLERDFARSASDVLTAKVKHPVAMLIQNLESQQQWAATLLEEEVKFRPPVDEREMVRARRDLYIEAARRYEDASNPKEATL